MRRIILVLPVLAVCFATAPAARAGLYNRVDQSMLSTVALKDVKKVLIQLRESRIAGVNPEKGSLKSMYQQEVKRLESILRTGSLSTVERAELGAYYLRLGRAEEARTLLEAGDTSHFLILLHLAEAYHELSPGSPNLLLRAISYQQQALDRWPAVWALWTGSQWGFYRRAEQLNLKLLNLRFAESRSGRRSQEGPGLDPLFGDVQFVGPSGKYEAGRFKQEEVEKLPDTAYPLTFQLVLWRPHDDRLVWLLAELIHLGGRIDIAWDLMEYIHESSKLSSWRTLFRHRQILFDPAKVMKRLQADEQELLFALVGLTTMRPPPQGGVGGAIGSEIARWTPSIYAERERRRLAGAFSGPGIPPDPNPTPAPRVLFDWRSLAIGFGVGLAVALLAGLQWQEWRRRRQAARFRQAAAEAETEAEAEV